MNRKSKKILFFSLIFVCLFGSIIFVVALPLAPFGDDSNIYITADDVIKNFRVDTFNGEALTDSGTVPSLGNKLKFETGSAWTAKKEDLNILYYEIVDNIVYLYYEIPMKQKINIYTNVRLADVAESLTSQTETFSAGSYKHYGCFGGDPLDSWSSNLYWKHYNFGNLYTHNSLHNTFGGTLSLTFDIAQSPLPDIFTDSEGNTVTKQFDYISVPSAYVSSTTFGDMTTTGLTSVVGITPSEFKSETINTVSGGQASGTTHGFTYLWDPNPTLSTPIITEQIDYGIQSQSVGSSLNPKLKSGEPTWDPKNTGASMPDCKLTYNLGAISPIVQKWSSTLTYDKQTLITVDVIKAIIPIVIEPKVQQDSNLRMVYTRDVALKAINRFIQFEATANFRVWTTYQIQIPETDDIQLENPTEYVGDLIWESLVSGFSQGKTYTEGYVFDTLSILIVVIVIIVAIIAVLVFLRKGLPNIIKSIRK